MDFSGIDAATAWDVYEPKGGGLTKSDAAHLLRRAAFGPRPGELPEFSGLTPAAAIQRLLTAQESDAFQKEVAALNRATLATGKPENVAAAWAHRMRHTTAPLREKMVLFWHGHFATSAEKVDDASMMLAQNQQFRKHATGHFKPLVHAIARDPAMLIYLDSTTNRKAHPNENFARELMELFCLGEGHYSEQDIRELSRCFTGWEVKRNRFRFNRYQHDGGTKTIFDRAGVFSGEDGVDIVLEQNSLEEFIVRKLTRFFVCDEPDLPDVMVKPLAQFFREQDLQIAPLLQKILSSNLFYSKMAMGRKVRSPVELIVGTLQLLDGTTNLYRMTSMLSELGQKPFYPPNVKGWDGGRAWINTSTLLARANAVRSILRREESRFGGKSLSEYLDSQDLNRPEQVFDFIATQFVAVSVNAEVRQAILNGTRDDPDPRRAVIETMAALPEFQLA